MRVDNEVMGYGVKSTADCVVTGDPHLLRLSHFHGIRTVDADELLSGYWKSAATRSLAQGDHRCASSSAS